jgi:hypothetical protein
MKNLKDFKMFVEDNSQYIDMVIHDGVRPGDKNDCEVINELQQSQKLQHAIDLLKGKTDNKFTVTTLYKQGNYQLYWIGPNLLTMNLEDDYNKNQTYMVTNGKSEYYLCDDFVANDKGEIVSYDIGKIIDYADNFEGRTNIRSSEVETFFNMIDEKF